MVPDLSVGGTEACFAEGSPRLVVRRREVGSCPTMDEKHIANYRAHDPFTPSSLVAVYLQPGIKSYIRVQRARSLLANLHRHG